MRTTKVIAITMPPEMAKQAERLAKKQNRTMSELMREAFRRYQQSEHSTAVPLLDAIRLLQEDAWRSGLKPTRKEIDSEIAGVRRAVRSQKSLKR
jgi:predicted DNA-binding protein